MSLHEEIYDEIMNDAVESAYKRAEAKTIEACLAILDSCKTTRYIDVNLEYVVIPLAQAKAKLQAIKGVGDE